MVYWQHWGIGLCVTVLLRNLLRWRADDIRPYTVCATELAGQKFRGIQISGCIPARNENDP